MKKKFTLLTFVMVFALLAVALTGCGGNKNYAANNTEFVIGVSGPLTGDASIYGIAVQNGAQLAVDEINAAGGLNGVKFKLVAIDDKNDASMIATNYSSLYEGGMQLSLGTVTTKPALEFKNLAKEDSVFFLTPSASGDAVPEFDNGYQMCFADGNQGAAAAGYVNENYSGKTIGIFYKSDDAYSKGIYDQFKAALDSSVSTVDTAFNDANTTDFSSQIDTLKDCEFIFMPIYYTPASLFMTQAKTIISAKTVYYGCDGFDGIDSIEGFDIATVPQEVSMLSHFNSKATDGNAKTFIDKYTATYGKETLNQFGASAYDCVYAIFNALKEIETATPGTVKVTLSASEFCNLLKAKFNGGFTYSGVTGENIRWESNGYVSKTPIKYNIKAAD